MQSRYYQVLNTACKEGDETRRKKRRRKTRRRRRSALARAADVSFDATKRLA